MRKKIAGSRFNPVVKKRLDLDIGIPGLSFGASEWRNNNNTFRTHDTPAMTPNFIATTEIAREEGLDINRLTRQQAHDLLETQEKVNTYIRAYPGGSFRDWETDGRPDIRGDMGETVTSNVEVVFEDEVDEVDEEAEDAWGEDADEDEGEDGEEDGEEEEEGSSVMSRWDSPSIDINALYESLGRRTATETRTTTTTNPWGTTTRGLRNR